ncbi:MAG TPA: hypothetical protein PLV56_04305, partial [Synergistales bacterium]|nr:hypothetical protein [Synergistales bacterium]
PQTYGPLSFFASEGDLEVVVKATHPGVAAGIQPSVSWNACSDPADGFQLVWEDPSPGTKWEISEVTVSAINEADLYKYEGSWGVVDNPSVFSVLPEECFKAEGGIPGDDDDDDDDIVTGWEVEVESDDPSAAADIVPVDNPCSEDYFTFSFDIDNCENVIALDVTFYLDCDLIGDVEYGIWMLVPDSDCEWEFVGGELERVEVEEGVFECMLTWELTGTEYDFCDLGDVIFGIGPAPEQAEPEVISFDLDGTTVTVTLFPCDGVEEINSSFDVTMIPIEELPDVGLDLSGVASDDVSFFAFNFEDPTGICGIQVCWEADEGETCEDFANLGVFYFSDDSWEEIMVDCDDSGEPAVICFALDDPQLIQDLLGDPGTIFGVGDAGIFGVAPGDDDDDHDGGGGCNVGGFSAGLLLLAAPL